MIAALMMMVLVGAASVPLPDLPTSDCVYDSHDIDGYLDCQSAYVSRLSAVFTFRVMVHDIQYHLDLLEKTRIASGLLSGHLVVDETTHTLVVVP